MEQQQLTFQRRRRVYSVSEIVYDIRGNLERAFRDLWVQGEISNLRCPSTGHLYFTLKDSDNQISAVCFRSQARYLQFEPEDGMEISARGSISVYPPRGQLQLVVEYMEPRGRGALQAAFEKLKARLATEGLFAPDRKKRLPLLPSKIGVVTSPSGAAIRDMLKVLERRNNRLHVLIYPTPVQGPDAGKGIVQGIRRLNRRPDVDVIILSRGGGSLEDLWAFNEERVARAIFHSRVPVISAVGHEIDFTIADFVADVRAPTPSAAAELVSSHVDELCERVDALRRRSYQAFRLLLHQKRAQLTRLASSRALVSADQQVRIFQQRLDELVMRLPQSVNACMAPPRELFLRLKEELTHQMRFYVQGLCDRVGRRSEQLAAFSPLQVLKRGYAIVSTGEGRIVRHSNQLRAGETFKVQLSNSDFRARKEEENGEGV